MCVKVPRCVQWHAWPLSGASCHLSPPATHRRWSSNGCSLSYYSQHSYFILLMAMPRGFTVPNSMRETVVRMSVISGEDQDGLGARVVVGVAEAVGVVGWCDFNPGIRSLGSIGVAEDSSSGCSASTQAGWPRIADDLVALEDAGTVEGFFLPRTMAVGGAGKPNSVCIST